MKEIQDDKKMERYFMFLDRENQYCENDYITKHKLQIPCDPYQITNGIFHRTRTKNFTIHRNTKDSWIAKAFEKEEWIWRNQPSWLQIILQSYTHQDSMALSQRQKYRSMEQNRKLRNESRHLWSPYLWQRKQKYLWTKTICLTSGAGKTGQTPVKNWN